MAGRPHDRTDEDAERWRLLRSLDRFLTGPLVILSFVWIGILVLEFTGGTDARLDWLFYAIWAVFIVEVLIELLIAPSRTAYLRGNWLKVGALFVPALRVLRALTAVRFLRLAGATRSVSLIRLLTSLNRGMAALGATLDRARFGYMVVLTILVIVVGAAGMLLFEGPEGPENGNGLSTYGDALWWTAMVMTTIGTDYFPVTAEGRALAWALSLFAIGVFSYVTATIASFLLGLGDARSTAYRRDEAFRVELEELRAQMAALNSRLKETAT